MVGGRRSLRGAWDVSGVATHRPWRQLIGQRAGDKTFWKGLAHHVTCSLWHRALAGMATLLGRWADRQVLTDGVGDETRNETMANSGRPWAVYCVCIMCLRFS